MLEKHLGGHNNKTHLDEGALVWMKNKFNAKSFLDIGCGTGGMVSLAEENGLDSHGIDGDYTVERYKQNNFTIHDFTVGPAPVSDVYDIGWSCEFVEHVYEQYMPNYMKAFQQCRVVAITYAPPNWPGHHHVNLQEERYWIDKMSDYGFIFDKELTLELRNKSTMNLDRKKKAFVRNRGLLFINSEQ